MVIVELVVALPFYFLNNVPLILVIKLLILTELPYMFKGS